MTASVILNEAENADHHVPDCHRVQRNGDTLQPGEPWPGIPTLLLFQQMGELGTSVL